MQMSNYDPYLFDDCEVLRNNLGIRDRDILEQYEADTVTARMLVLRKNGFEINSIFDIKKIHKFIFGHVFDWAGETRVITMYKREKILSGYSVSYSEHQFIEEDLKDLDKKFQKINWDSLSQEEKVTNVCDIVQELWQIHSFREGNTRTTALFLYFLLKQVGLHINSEFLGENSIYFRNSLVLASIGHLSKKEYLYGIVKDCVSYLDVDQNKYKTIEGQNCEKYDARSHTVEKLKTIKDFRDFRRIYEAVLCHLRKLFQKIKYPLIWICLR